MKRLHTIIVLSLIAMFTSCLGDKKAVDIAEMSDTSFRNSNFKGNRINFNDEMSACENLTSEAIARIYKVSADDILFDDHAKNPQRQKTGTPICSFFIKSGTSDFQWLRGSMAVNREIVKDEFMGEVHEATGGGENWEEAWAMKKSMSKSSEWISDCGMAALWNDNYKELKIKFEGYTLTVFPPNNKINELEMAQNRDYKKVALAMAKAAGYIN